jgi:two-component system LytT family response regulator
MKNQVLKAIIVDDEQPSREALANYLLEFCLDVEVLAECNSARSAFRTIAELSPDLVFLDIEMPKGSGFDLLRKFENIPFKIIFVTAFSEYAVQAFRFSATDYLMKPVKVSELKEAVAKVKAEIMEDVRDTPLQVLMENLGHPAQEIHKLVIPDHKGFVVVDISELLYCEADGYCTVFQFTGKRKETSSKNIGYYEELLTSYHFLRVHNSFLVNTRKVTGYSSQGVIFLSEGGQCPLGTRFRNSFLAHFKRFR